MNTHMQMKLVARALVLVLMATASQVLARDDLLDPDDAFEFSAALVSADTIEVTYRIADGYYLYRKAFEFSVKPASITIGVPQFPPGAWHHDEFFGRSEVYRGRVSVRIPLKTTPRKGVLRLIAVSQGCADIGVCYLPHTQVADLVLSKLLGSMDQAAK